MTPETIAKLKDFEARHKPDSRTYLVRFREEIVYLHFQGYSLKLTFQYLKEQGVGCSLSTFERWVKTEIDFTKEPVPEAGKRTLRIGSGAANTAQQPLVTEGEGTFSLAGASADSTALRPSALVNKPTTDLPKHPVLVAENTPPTLQSETEAGPKAGPPSRAAALAEARSRVEKGFKNPVDSALESREK